MAKINLLPWREELRQQKKKEFLIAIAVAVTATLVAFAAVHSYIEGLKSYQEKRNKMLTTEITAVDKTIDDIKAIDEKKAKLLAKIDLIQKLQESRPEIVHLFAEIPKITPDGIYLSSFKQVGADLTFEGKSQSNAQVSALMRAIDVSQWMNSPALKIIELPNKANVDRISDFTLQAKQGKKEKPAQTVQVRDKS
ncbi:MAG: PilN domain-containing protein [Methylococcaceae bacterium]